MTTSDSIVRNNVDSDGLDFATLRQEGIAFAQELSGNLWTDYNTHDPGITILEQLCFGLTELAYQAGISVPDYLADSRGKINYEEFGLLKPHDVLPSAPVTPSDYCKLLLDAIPTIDRIEFIPLVESRKHYTGLYRINIKLLEPITGQPFTVEQKALVIKAVQEKYSEWRNLNEDIDDIIIEDSTPCFLTGTVETTGKRNPAEVHADIFFQCARKISSNVRIERYEHVFANGASLTDIFTGPLTQHGYISEAPSQAINTPKVLDELSGLIAKIGGVKKVYDLQLVDSEGKVFTPEDIFTKSFYLCFPEFHQPQLSIYFNAGKTNNTQTINSQSRHNYEKHLNSSKRHLQKLEFEYRAFRANKGNAGEFYSLPHANVPTDHHYYSIQNHFPDIYGVNAAGVPHWASLDRKLSAQQLKAYLYPFEQVMANFQQMLQHLKKIFSLSEHDLHTYFSAFLDNSNIPNIEQLFKYKINSADPTGVSAEQQLMVRRVSRKYDNAIDRKNRALDSLLAIYGEEFSQDGLLEFNYYHQELPKLWAIQNKLRYLKNIRDLSARRNGAFNIQLPYWGTENLSWVQKKISILLGLESFNKLNSLSDIFSRFNLRLVADEVLLKSGISESLDDADCVPHVDSAQLIAIMKWRYNPSKPLTVCHAMLTHGLSLDSYRLMEKNNEFYVYFRLYDKSVVLKKSASKEKAIDYIYKFKKIITDANAKAEGFFMLEHLLLRPRQALSSNVSNDFFKAQLSIVFPAWTARFSNPAFQEYAEKTICNNLPAHLFPNIYWVEREEMSAFETLYQNWLKLIEKLESERFTQANSQSNTTALDAAANALIDWLLERRSSQNYWV